ncbi:hypothetical protein EDF84_101369 [Erwinia rhapontici]|nr:hypothetical protein EDF84_101369 [Erwinia rhapontici]
MNGTMMQEGYTAAPRQDKARVCAEGPHKTRPALLAATFFNPDSNQSAETVTWWGL